jgi:hypothetical protein
VSETNLAGVKIIGRWRHKKTNTIYSLAELDMKYIKQTMTTYRDMNADFRNYFDKNAEKTFDKMEQK